MVDTLTFRRVAIRVKKVKGHITDEDVGRGTWSVYEQQVNNYADHYAEEGAKLTKIKEQLYPHNDRADAKAYCILYRLMVIAKAKLAERSGKAELAKLVVHTPSFMDNLNALGHSMVPFRKHSVKCTYCLQVIHRSLYRRAVEVGAECQGLGSLDPVHCDAHPVYIPQGNALCLGRQPSHIIME